MKTLSPPDGLESTPPVRRLLFTREGQLILVGDQKLYFTDPTTDPSAWKSVDFVVPGVFNAKKQPPLLANLGVNYLFVRPGTRGVFLIKPDGAASSVVPNIRVTDMLSANGKVAFLRVGKSDLYSATLRAGEEVKLASTALKIPMTVNALTAVDVKNLVVSTREGKKSSLRVLRVGRGSVLRSIKKITVPFKITSLTTIKGDQARKPLLVAHTREGEILILSYPRLSLVRALTTTPGEIQIAGVLR